MVEKLAFNLSNFLHQDFPFSEKLINYVNQEADAEVKQMLDRSCKHFYKEAPYLIIDTLEINETKQRLENEAYGGCIDFIDDDQLQTFLGKSNNIWVTKKLNVSLNPELDDLDVEFIDKIIRCDASEVSIFNAIWPLSKFKTLTKSEKVECMDMSTSSIIFGHDGSPVPLEDILALVPNARIIWLDNCHVTDETMSKLLATPWKNKITEFFLINVDGPLCPNLFFKFVKKHVDPEAKIHVDFKNETDTFHTLYNQMVIDSGERMPTIGSVAHLVKKPTKVQHLLSWMASFTSIIEIIQGDSVPFKKLPVPKKYEKVTYSDENVERQYTAFPYPHMCYIRETADAETWKKLEQTCKFFFQKNPYFMVDDFHVAADNKITLMVDNKKVIFNNEMEMRIIGKPLWITNSINIAGMGGLYMNARLDAIKISMGTFIHSMDNFICLTKSGKVKEWNAIDALIKNNDYSKIKSLNELLIHLPYVEVFRANVRGIQPCYPNEPISLSQSNKIKYLEIIFLEDPIQTDSLFDILKTSLAPKAVVKIDLSYLIEEMDIDGFKAQMKTKLDTWKPQIDKPTLKIVS